MTVTFTAEDSRATEQLGKDLAAELQASDIVLLSGDLGAGKTFLVQSICRALGTMQPASSPTFTIAQVYATPSGIDVLHVDAYRLDGLREFHDLGLEDYFTEGISLIEWGEKIADDFSDYLHIHIRYIPENPAQRLLSLTAYGERWAQFLGTRG